MLYKVIRHQEVVQIVHDGGTATKIGGVYRTETAKFNCGIRSRIEASNHIQSTARVSDYTNVRLRDESFEVGNILFVPEH